MRPGLSLAILLLAVAAPAARGQPAAAAPGGPQLQVSLLPSNSPPSGASIRTARLLDDRQMRDLLQNGFPAALHFRLELWRVGGLFNDLESAAQWEVLVRYDPYSQRYMVVRRQGTTIEDFGGFRSLEEAAAVIDRPYPVRLKPARAGTRYYYNVVLDVETLSVSDLDELQRWLSGEFQPAVRGKRAPLSALRRGLGTLLSRVLGGEKRHYEARTGKFRA